MAPVVSTGFFLIQGRKYYIILLNNVLSMKDDDLMNASQIASSNVHKVLLCFFQ